MPIAWLDLAAGAVLRAWVRNVKKGSHLPWGRTDNGEVLMWRTRGPPQQWTVVISDGSDLYDTELGFAEFLARFVDKTLGSPAFPDDLPVAGAKFFAAK